MESNSEQRTDVVIVGAGPVGLLLAIELTLAGARPLVLERLAGINPVMKAMGVGPLGIEALERRGMADAIAAAEARNFEEMKRFALPTGVDLRSKRISGHFAGLSLIRKDAQREPERRARGVVQQDLEAMLGERARSLGIEVRRGCEVTGIVRQDDGVDVEWTSPLGEERVRGAYLVGCDGGRSPTRKAVGFDFPGTPPTLTFYQVIAQVDRPELLSPPGWRRTSGGVFAYGPIPGRLVMLDFSGPPEDREAPLEREEIEGVLRRVSGKDVRVRSLEAGSRWTDNTRLVDTYRKGRVLLAGDAAHVHSPFGGQGMNLGLVDAANLGWKLAAVVRGRMPESLLDTYTDERRPVAEAVLSNNLAQLAIMRPDPQSGAMRDLFARLMEFDDVDRLIGGMMNGTSSRYDLGSERDEVGRLIGNRSVGPDGATLYGLMKDGAGVFLDASPEAKDSDLVRSVAPTIRRTAVESGPSMLIRPDACVAWAGEEAGTEGLEKALGRWFKPSPSARTPSAVDSRPGGDACPKEATGP